MDFIDLIDACAVGYNSNFHDVLRWSWREVLVSSQAIKRRLDRRDAARNDREALSAAEKRALLYDSQHPSE